MPAFAPATIKNFSGLSSLEDVTAQLDLVFARLQDVLGTNPMTHSLLNGKEPVGNQKAGDFVMDYRDGKVTPGMSDGKEVKPFEVSTLSGIIKPEQHGQQDSQIFDADGNVVGAMHSNATTTLSGFMSASDKVQLDGILPATVVPVLADASAGAVGVSLKYARQDHTHQIAVGTPQTIGSSNLPGASTNLARADHLHNHGNQAGGSLHAAATSSVAGFMPASDRVEVARLNALNIDGITDTGNHYILITIGGTVYRTANLSTYP